MKHVMRDRLLLFAAALLSGIVAAALFQLTYGALSGVISLARREDAIFFYGGTCGLLLTGVLTAFGVQLSRVRRRFRSVWSIPKGMMKLAAVAFALLAAAMLLIALIPTLAQAFAILFVLSLFFTGPLPVIIVIFVM